MEPKPHELPSPHVRVYAHGLTTRTSRSSVFGRWQLQRPKLTVLTKTFFSIIKAARVSSGLSSYRSYIHFWAATDPRWHKPTQYQSIEVDRKRIPFEDQLLVAKHYVHARDYSNAGHMLRAAFLSIEPLVNDQHISGAWDLFIIGPLVIGEMGRDTDVVMKLYTK